MRRAHDERMTAHDGQKMTDNCFPLFMKSVFPWRGESEAEAEAEAEAAGGRRRRGARARL